MEHIPQVIKAAAWRIATELVRKHPDRLRLVEQRPGDGKGDCLTLVDRRDEMLPSVFMFDRASKSTGVVLDGRDFTWQDYLAAPDPKSVIRKLMKAAGLPEHSMPPTEPETLVLRVIAAFMTHSVLGVVRWDCRAGVEDAHQYSGGLHGEYFECFPEPRALLRENGADILEQCRRAPESIGFCFVTESRESA